MVKQNRTTMIKVKVSTREILKKCKITSRETYDEIINRIIKPEHLRKK